MVIELDYMEYPTDALAQAAYLTSAIPTIFDQETTANDITVLGDHSDVEYRVANKIVLPSPTIITQVKFTFGANVGSPSGNVTCRVETDNAGLPSGILAHANATKAITVIPNTENTWEFTDFYLPPGTYWVVLDCDDQATDNRWLIRMNYGISPLGKAARSIDGVWIAQNDRTHTYKIYELSLQSFSEATIKEQGDYSLNVIAKATGSLNETLTRTVDPTIDLSDQNTIKFYIYASRTGTNIQLGIHDLGGITTTKDVNIITSNVWQEIIWDISGLANVDKDAIDKIIVKIINADVGNTFYVDNMYVEIVILAIPLAQII